MQSSLDNFFKTKSTHDSSTQTANETSNEAIKQQEYATLEENSADDQPKQIIDLTVTDNKSGKAANKPDLSKSTRNVMKRGISIAVVPHRKQDLTEERTTKKQKIKPVDEDHKKEISSGSPVTERTNTENTKRVKFDDSVVNNKSKATKETTSRPVLTRSKTTPIPNQTQRSNISNNNNNNNKTRNEDSDDTDKSQSESSSEFTTKDRSSSIIKHEHITPTGQRIQVRHGDITAEDTDTVVNAANGALAHGAGVAGAIVRAGGPAIQRESDRWIDKFGSVDTGDVAVTSGGNMLCKYVIHAVGPVWYGGKHNEKQDLYSCVINSLKKATELKLASISLPAISSGIFGFPRDLCAKIMFDSALKFCETNTDTTLKQIRFTNIDHPTVSVFCSEFVSRFESQSDSDE